MENNKNERITYHCSQCDWEGDENGLQWVSTHIRVPSQPDDDYEACPNCLTDTYLRTIHWDVEPPFTLTGFFKDMFNDIKSLIKRTLKIFS